MKYILPFVLLFTVLFGHGVAQEPASIRGYISTSDGKPAPGVTITIAGTSRKSVSDHQGNFAIRGLSPGSYSIQITSVGLSASQKTVNLSAGTEATVNFILKESAQVLHEVNIDAQRKEFIAKSSDYVGKMPLMRLENPQMYSTVKRALLEQQQALSMEDGLKNVPGIVKILDASGIAANGGASFASRGFITTARLRNGMASSVTNTVDASNLESIEVIKGPSATLFGNQLSGYGGLVNRVTKKPYETFGGELGFSTGSYGLNRITADVNTPLKADGSVLFRLNAAYQQENSFQDYGFRKALALSPSFIYKASEKLSFQLDAELYRFRQAGMAQAISVSQPSQLNGALAGLFSAMGMDPNSIGYLTSLLPTSFEGAYGTNRADEINIGYKRAYIGNDIVSMGEVANFFGQMNYDFNDKWKSTTVISSSNNSSDGDSPYFYLLPNYLGNFLTSLLSGQAPTVGEPGHDQMMRMALRPISRDNVLQVQQNFRGDFHIGSLRNRLVMGLDWFNGSQDNNYQHFTSNLFGILPTLGLFDVVNTSGNVPNYKHLNKGKLDSAYAAGYSVDVINYIKVNTYGAYISDVLNVTDKLLLSAGLRLDRFDNRGNYNPMDGTYVGGFKQTVLSPKFGLVFQAIKDRLSLFGNYQNGFANINGADQDGNTFKPEQALQWEGGVKTDLFDSRLVASISYYDINVKNIVRIDPENPNFSVQRGNQLSKGIEGELLAQPLKGLNVLLGYAYNDSKMKDAGADVEGLRPGTAGPAHIANWWLAYQLPETTVKGLGLGIGGNYASEVAAFNSHSEGKFILPAYTVWNASVFLDKGRYRLAGRLNNLANKHYWVGWTTMNPQMPQQFFLSLAYKF